MGGSLQRIVGGVEVWGSRPQQIDVFLEKLCCKCCIFNCSFTGGRSLFICDFWPSRVQGGRSAPVFTRCLAEIFTRRQVFATLWPRRPMSHPPSI